MPKKIIQKYLPHPDKLKDHNHLKIFGSLLLKNQIWNLNRYTTPRAFAIGIFCAFLPMPFQMVAAAAIAIPFHANLPLSVALVWLTNPITIPPIFYFCYRVGVWIMQVNPKALSIELSFDWLSSQLGQIWQPLLLGSLICGIFFSTISYYTVKLLWRISAARKWKSRNRNLAKTSK